jgi:hypothetical protein
MAKVTHSGSRSSLWYDWEDETQKIEENGMKERLEAERELCYIAQVGDSL